MVDSATTLTKDPYDDLKIVGGIFMKFRMSVMLRENPLNFQFLFSYDFNLHFFFQAL